MTLAFWTASWWWWLLGIFLSWLTMEIGSIVTAKETRQKTIDTWTLSDTIRRWSSAHRWLAPLAVGSTAFLLVHFFGQSNP